MRQASPPEKSLQGGAAGFLGATHLHAAGARLRQHAVPLRGRMLPHAVLPGRDGSREGYLGCNAVALVALAPATDMTKAGGTSHADHT